jgi:hypothetical protein
MTTKTMPSTAGFAVSDVKGFGVKGTGLPVTGWRQVQAPISGSEVSTAGATSTLTKMPIARNKANAVPAPYAVPATNAVPVSPAVKPAVLPLGTTLHLVTTQHAGRGNKGSSPWRFPV